MAIIYTITNEPGCYMIFCPGCKCGHKFDSRWAFNGNMEKPTFVGSMLVKWTADRSDGPIDHVCHSFVREGKIQFLSDCTHHLVNQTVDLPDF